MSPRIPLLVMVAALGGCKRPADEVTLRLASQSQLLPGIGATSVADVVVDGAGDEPPAVTWRSDDPSIVSVDAGGTLEAHAIGSTFVYAEAEGVVSEPLLAWVATVPDGAVLVADEQVVEGPVALGTHLEVVLADVDVPAPGTVVLSTQDAPVAGKVVTASAGADGVTVELEVVGLPELFVDVDLAAHDTATIEPGSELAREFTVAGFACKTDESADVEPQIDLQPTLSEALTFDRDIVLRQRGRVVERAMVQISGRLQLDLAGSLTFPIELQAPLECKREVGALRFPLPGALSFLAAKVPLGIGFTLDGSFEATAVVFRADGYARADVVVGMDYTPTGGLQPIDDFDASHALRVTWDSPLLETGATVKASAFPFAYAELQVGPIFDVPLLPDAELAELRAGVKGEYELSPPEDQAGSPELASKYAVAVHGELQPGSGVRTVLGWFGVDAETIAFDPPDDAAIFRSPQGTTSTSTDAIVASEPVTLTTDLDPETVTYVEGYNVDSVHVWRRDATGWHEVADLPAQAEQTRFEYEWTPSQADEDEGSAEFAVTVETLEMPGVQLEIAPDSRQQVGSASGEALAEIQGTYDVVETVTWEDTSGSLGSGTQVQPYSDQWEILPTYLKWYDTNYNGSMALLYSFGDEGDPNRVTFSGTGFSYAKHEELFPDDPCGPYVVDQTITGNVTSNDDGSAEIVVTLLYDQVGAYLDENGTDCVSFRYWRRHDFVGTRPPR